MKKLSPNIKELFQDAHKFVANESGNSLVSTEICAAQWIAASNLVLAQIIEETDFSTSTSGVSAAVESLNSTTEDMRRTISDQLEHLTRNLPSS
jgi:ATP-dependent Clp protease ATP-binding subunit ClpA